MTALFALYLSPANTHENSSVTAIVVKVTKILVTGEEGDMRYDNIEDVLMSIKSIERNEFVRNMIVNFNRLLFV